MSGDSFYPDFLHAVLHGACATPQVAALLAQPAFAVYRNTVFKGCVEALAANFPAVARLTGEAWFQGAAHAYALARPPQDPCLIVYGAGFPDWLEECQAAHGLPYLSGVAALDRCWTEAHVAADAEVIDAAALQSALAAGHDLQLAPHPAARWRWEAHHPCYAIWDANRHGGGAASPAWQGQGALLTRPYAEVAWQPLGPGGCGFMDACGAGLPVSLAAAQALQAEPDLDPGRLLAQLVQAGAFTTFRRTTCTT